MGPAHSPRRDERHVHGCSRVGDREQELKRPRPHPHLATSRASSERSCTLDCEPTTGLSCLKMSSSAAATAHSFNKILNLPKSSSKTRTPLDVEEAVRKLRRLILVDGIPSSVVSGGHSPFVFLIDLYCRTPRCGQGSGKSCCACMMSLQPHSLITSGEALVKCERRSATTRSGRFPTVITTGRMIADACAPRTLATDKGFKDRVGEDMLIRLLDAFVWRNHGASWFNTRLPADLSSFGEQTGRKCNSSVSITCRA